MIGALELEAEGRWPLKLNLEDYETMVAVWDFNAKFDDGTVKIDCNKACPKGRENC